MSKKASKRRAAGSYRSVGETYDGVLVIKPKTKPKNFTTAQIRSTIKAVLRDSTSGAFVKKKRSASNGKES